MSFYYSSRDIQVQLAAMGHDPGGIDGMMGPNTRKAINKALDEIGGDSVQDLFDPSGLHSIVWHWTAGAKGINSKELRSYNALVDQHSNIYDGVFRPEAQATYAIGRAASHTLNANTHRIGISMDCMAGAKERPLQWGSNPMTEGHIEGMLEQTAIWCKHFGIIPSKFTTLSHAEVQPTLGIKQRWKWDIACLPGMKSVEDPVKIGDHLRERLEDYL